MLNRAVSAFRKGVKKKSRHTDSNESIASSLASTSSSVKSGVVVNRTDDLSELEAAGNS